MISSSGCSQHGRRECKVNWTAPDRRGETDSALIWSYLPEITGFSPPWGIRIKMWIQSCCSGPPSCQSASVGCCHDCATFWMTRPGDNVTLMVFESILTARKIKNCIGSKVIFIQFIAIPTLKMWWLGHYLFLSRDLLLSVRNRLQWSRWKTIDEGLCQQSLSEPFQVNLWECSLASSSNSHLSIIRNHMNHMYCIPLN